jgi:hypothetical protein
MHAVSFYEFVQAKIPPSRVVIVVAQHTSEIWVGPHRRHSLRVELGSVSGFA